jgi:hypothetical protein
MRGHIGRAKLPLSRYRGRNSSAGTSPSPKMQAITILAQPKESAVKIESTRHGTGTMSKRSLQTTLLADAWLLLPLPRPSRLAPLTRSRPSVIPTK